MQFVGNYVSREIQLKNMKQALKNEQKLHLLMARANQDYFRDGIQPVYNADNRTTEEKLQDTIYMKTVLRDEIRHILKDEHEVGNFMKHIDKDGPEDIRRMLTVYPLIYERVKDLRLLTGNNLYDYCDTFVDNYDANKLLNAPTAVPTVTGPIEPQTADLTADQQAIPVVIPIDPKMTKSTINRMNAPHMQKFLTERGISVEEERDGYMKPIRRPQLRDMVLEIWERDRVKPVVPVPVVPVPVTPVTIPVQNNNNSSSATADNTDDNDYYTREKLAQGDIDYCLQYLRDHGGEDYSDVTAVEPLANLRDMALRVFDGVSEDQEEPFLEAEDEAIDSSAVPPESEEAVSTSVSPMDIAVQRFGRAEATALRGKINKATALELRGILDKRKADGSLGFSTYSPSHKTYSKKRLADYVFDSLVNDADYDLKSDSYVSGPYINKKGNKKPHRGFGFPQFGYTAPSTVGKGVVKVKYGKGIDGPKVKMDPYVPFGKFVLHSKQLEDHNILNIKYKSGSQVPPLPRRLISESFSEFLFDVLKQGKVNALSIKTLTGEEKDLFYTMVKLAGLSDELSLPKAPKVGSGFKIEVNSNKSTDLERFNVLRGEILAGNTNPAIRSEFKTLIQKLIKTKAIDKDQGEDILSSL
jgi:hypothetical protein